MAIQLIWTDPFDGYIPLTRIEIYRGLSEGAEVKIGEVAPGVETYYDDTVESGVYYYYYILAFNADGSSPVGNRLYILSYTIPTRPLDLIVADGVSLTLFWAAPSSTGASPILNYRIYRGLTPGSEVFLASVDGSTLTYVDAALSVKYYYKVSAVNSAGEGAKSNEAYPVSSPIGLSGVFSAPDVQITLTWVAPLVGVPTIPFFYVYRKVEGGIYSLIGTTSLTFPKYVDSAIEVDKIYTYKVSCYNGSLQLFSNEDEVREPRPRCWPISNLTAALSLDVEGIKLDWTDPFSESALLSVAIYRGTTPGGEDASPIATVDAGVQTYTDEIGPGTYYYIAKGRNSGGYAPASNEVNCEVPAWPDDPPLPITDLTGVTDLLEYSDTSLFVAGVVSSWILPGFDLSGKYIVIDGIEHVIISNTFGSGIPTLTVVNTVNGTYLWSIASFTLSWTDPFLPIYYSGVKIFMDNVSPPLTQVSNVARGVQEYVVVGLQPGLIFYCLANAWNMRGETPSNEVECFIPAYSYTKVYWFWPKP